MFKSLLRPIARYTVNKNLKPFHSTQVFHKLTDKELATPQMMSALVRKRIPFHSRMSQSQLYHGKRVRHAVKTCFSQKKTKRFKRVHKVQANFKSEVLDQKLRFVCSMKAYRTIKKYGSIDNYILCTKPQNLDSKKGQYLRTIMLRKINDPDYRIPYILGSNRKKKIKKFFKYQANEKANRLVIPKQFKKSLTTFQRKFGTSVDELSNEDYQKYLELEKLKKVMGSQIEPDHPLVLQLDRKLRDQLTPEEEQKLNEMSEKAISDYLNNPHNNAERRAKFEKTQKEAEILQLKIREAFIKYQGIRGIETFKQL